MMVMSDPTGGLSLLPGSLQQLHLEQIEQLEQLEQLLLTP
jgi:hypothetical protein